MFYTDLILNWLGKLPNPFQVFWPSDLRVLKDVLYLCVCLNWIPCCHSTLPPGIMIWGNSNLTLLGELHVSVFPIVWYKREKKIIKYFLCIYSLQNLTSLWPYSTSKNHILKKGNLESSQPRKVSKQSPAVLIRWFIKDLI